MQSLRTSALSQRAHGLGSGLRTPAPRAWMNGRGSVAAAAAATNFDKWIDWVDSAKKTGPAPKADPAVYAALTKAVAKAAQSYVPQHKGAPKLNVQFSEGLHQSLEKVALDCLKQFLDVPESGSINADLKSYVTTDIDAAMQIAGTKVSKGGKEYAVLSAVVTETAGMASWSRLENLILHWATQEKAGAEWTAAPSGWKSDVGKDDPQGTVWDSHFEKHPLQGASGNECMYTLVLQLPLTGTLEKGGVVFVMKGESGSQATRWLKDSKTQADFFIDVQKFPAK